MTAYRRLRAEDRAGAQHVATAVGSFADDPRPAGSAALGDSTAYRRLRLGPYRVFYEVDEPASAVYIISVGVAPP